MYIALSYDISSSAGQRVKKICDQYLLHVQRSVYEGEISQKNLNRLKNALRNAIVPETDSVIIYRLDGFGGSRKEHIGQAVEKDLSFL